MTSQSTSNDHQEQHSGYGCITWLIGILITIVVVFFIVGVGFSAAGRFLVVSDPIEPANAVVILSGGTEGRLAEAAEIYKEELADLFVLTETGAGLKGYDQTYIQYLVERTLAMEIPAGAIRVTKEHSYNTEDEARAVLELLKAERAESAIVVTDPFHTRRARIIFRRVFAGSDIQVIIHPVSDHWYRPATWWMSLRGWQATLQEYARLLAMWSGFGG